MYTIHMLIPLKYVYLIGAIITYVPWLIFYWHRKDLRREMIIMSVLVTIVGIIAQYFWWTKDWWHPQTITGTRVGIEDILLGFGTGGVAAVLYEELFKRRLYRDRFANHNLGTLIITILLFAIGAYVANILKFNSFIATCSAFFIVGGILIFLRKDLLYDSLLTGLCLTIAVIPEYLLLEYISPGFFEKTWLWEHLSGLRFIGIPIEDLIFYFLFGFFIAPFYLYWKGEKLRKISTNVKR